MSINTEIQRIQEAKTALYNLLTTHSSSVTSTDTIDTYAGFFTEIIQNSAQPASIEYYRCEAVDTSSSSWSGFKAVNRGTYFEFETIATTGLQYITGTAPEVGEIYSSNCTVHVASLFEGVVATAEDEYTVYTPEEAAVTDETLAVSDATVSDAGELFM